jgi:CIC family chloride channel protein
MRRLMPVGVAAGIAAAFNAPIAAVTFTIEEIVGTLDQTVLSGVVVAAALAAVIERSVLGTHPVIEVAQTVSLEHASSLLFYGLLGLLAGGLSIAFTDGLLMLRKGFRGLAVVPSALRPALGGLVTGVCAVLVIRWAGHDGIHGGGYEAIGLALGGRLALSALALLCLAKFVATLFSYSSGGAGGIFAPSLCIGATLGGVVGYLDVFALDHHGGELGAFALVGMGAVFAGVVRAPITSVLIIFEMTGGYGLVLPLMIANMTAYGLARHFRPLPIYDALLEQDGESLPRGVGAPDPLLLERVECVLTRQPPVSPAARMEQVMDLLIASSSGVLALSPREHDHGVIVFDQLRDIWRKDGVEQVLVASDVARPVTPIRADGTLADALRRMDDLRIDALPVLDVDGSPQPVGVVTRAAIGRHLLQQHAQRRATGRSGSHPALRNDATAAETGT